MTARSTAGGFLGGSRPRPGSCRASGGSSSWSASSPSVSLVVARLMARDDAAAPDMAAAARRMEVGDYSVRVETKSRDEVGALAAAFNRMSEEFEHLEQSRRDLVANVSHELKTPIAAIRAHLENLLDGVEQPDPATLGVMLAQVERLGRLVDQLLDLSRWSRARSRSASRPCRSSPSSTT